MCTRLLDLKNVLKDHDGQEAFFNVMDRTTIVCPTGLIENEPTEKIVLFGDEEKCPTAQPDRKGLAE
jgi:hypothetical protein